jgi:hypothetical protein
VQRAGGVIAGFAGVEHQNLPAGAAEDERRAQAGRPGAYDDHVQHAITQLPIA